MIRNTVDPETGDFSYLPLAMVLSALSWVVGGALLLWVML